MAMGHDGRPMGKRHQEDVRKKIQASHIILRLNRAFDGKLDLTDQQVNIGKILLNKVLPDLKAVEHTGEVAMQVTSIECLIVRP